MVIYSLIRELNHKKEFSLTSIFVMQQLPINFFTFLFSKFSYFDYQRDYQYICKWVERAGIFFNGSHSNVLQDINYLVNHKI